ncbi:ATP-dependent zinc metalloprotease FtsH [Mucilaginibacter sp. JRF]|uniref:ATP-dependent zinc metalloprotease FtsH n=1 Tax=Mucilaginibacter sp. JRF TaxID=2780088 RepID=UPI0018816082|nr:ATP-dependent zinc metalloprotease FtsH [Mucilaginibacter sp. JRF]MBE9584915.1 ATP-dependent zinc metalloprotease FtsH [Mucilaginibacter sp. JRF]
MKDNKLDKPKPIRRLSNKKITPKPPKFNLMWLYAVVIIALLVVPTILDNSQGKRIAYKRFETQMLKQHDVDKVEVYKSGELVYADVFIKQASLNKPEYADVKKDKRSISIGSNGPQYTFTDASYESLKQSITAAEKDIPDEQKTPIVFVQHENWLSNSLFQFIIMGVLLVAIWMFIMRRMSGGAGGGPGGQIFNIGKSKATLFDKEAQVTVTFNDVAGLEEAKQEVMEIVDFLKNPKKYTNLGGKIPKGALLVGSPGTGKTLLAKAVAGEAQVPFFSLSGSDFVEMFVGVGASRVRDLFRQAKDKAPCIIFIDEIDAIGRARGKNNIVGGNDERENTLNQLLVEMDGFGTDSGIIILAATNRPDVLDSALLRPGRFDRQVSIDKPDLVGREQIFKVHLKPVKLAAGVDAKKLSAQTPGFAGAEIANVCNEAALIAARKNKEAVDMQDFQDAIDRVIGGLEKKNKIISPEEKRIVAYHEAGHAIAGWFLEHADPLVKVSIVPRGVAALGYAQYLPKEQFLYTTEQLLDGMCMTMGGRVAEDIVFNKISTGAQNDLERITKLAYAMVTIYGMNPKVGNVSFNDTQGEYQFNKPYSEKTSELIDEEVRNLIGRVYEMTKQLLNDKREGLEKLANKLLEKEILFQSDLEEILGKRPFDHRTTYDEFVNGAAQESNQDPVAQNLVHEGVNDHSGTFNRNPEEKDANGTEPGN